MWESAKAHSLSLLERTDPSLKEKWTPARIPSLARAVITSPGGGMYSLAIMHALDAGVVGVVLRDVPSGCISVACGPAGLQGGVAASWWGPDMVAMLHRMEASLSTAPGTASAMATHAIYACNESFWFYCLNFGENGLSAGYTPTILANEKIEDGVLRYQQENQRALCVLGGVIMSVRVPEFARDAVAQEALLKVALTRQDHGAYRC
jgi:hypothetical protein